MYVLRIIVVEAKAYIQTCRRQASNDSTVRGRKNKEGGQDMKGGIMGGGVEIVSRTGRDTGQGRTVKEERNCRAGQELPGKGMAHVPGGKGGSAERDDEWALGESLCLGIGMGSSPGLSSLI
jgi:hypothetical protein